MVADGVGLSVRIEGLVEHQIRVGIVAPYFVSGNDGDEVHYRPVGKGFICQVNPMRDPSRRGLRDEGKRGCFLCEANMPDDEEGIELCEGWKIYPNPRPYERNHVVLVRTRGRDHHPFQIIDEREQIAMAVETIRRIGYDEGRNRFNLTFNSVFAAASSRHLHFQIFECDLPIEQYPVKHFRKDAVTYGVVKDYPASVLVIEGDDTLALSSAIWDAVDNFNTHCASFIPYVILMKVIDGRVRAYLFPRVSENPAESKPGLIDVKFGVCEMSGMVIVYSDEMADQISERQYTESLRVVSDRDVLSYLYGI